MTEEHKIENSDGLTVGIIKNLQDAQGVMEIQIGVATYIVWGVGPITPEMLPVQNAPAGEQRIVLGNKMAATLYVKTENAVRVFTLVIKDGKLTVDPKLERKAVYSLPELQFP